MSFKLPLFNTRFRFRGAFTLVELLVSMALLIMLVGMLAQMMNQASAIWNIGEANKERMQDVRAVTEFMASELRTALLPVNRPTQTGLQFVVNPTSLSGDTYKNRDSVFWQAPCATDQSSGDVAEIGYFVKWDTEKDSPRPVLCRFFVNPTDKSNFLIYSKPADWLNTGIIESVAPATKQFDYNGLFAENVLGLWVDCLDPFTESIDKVDHKFDSRKGYTEITSKVVHSPCALPAAIDLGLVMLDSRSARRLTSNLKSKITTLAKQSSSAKDFVTEAQKDASFRPLLQSLRYYQTRVYLQNSK